MRAVIKSGLIAASVGALVAVLGASPAAAAPITVKGTYSIGQSGSATITDVLANPFTESLTVGTTVSAGDLFDIKEPLTSPTTNNITASFTFTQPTAASGSLGGKDTVTISGTTFGEALNWNDGGVLDVNFTNGSELQISLEDGSKGGSTSTYTFLPIGVSFDLLKGPREVPEPLTLSLFGAGLVGAAALRRRKKA